ncbi:MULTISPECIES: GNAT family N-acetyltransferase [Sphingobacterium]|uniref:GNAT family N-acetyltransferase n=1 Tax=Sphingobacterium TaxID=28453 RepID=UPI001042F42E|nr:MULTISPECIES: GNAT family N-acetyltransferase [Sphingobacterium]MCW2263278.1 ElaA protein [Sphingobacterium kitahiroshimense]TCR11738.1 ElaA protein [Sphingobacterium sp. JUb78]
MEKIYAIKSFKELSNEELYQILKLRSEVFVVEQHCVFQDMDNKDQESLHVMCYIDDKLAAYTRVLPEGLSFEEVSIGRVITSPLYRGLGLGKEIMEQSIAVCEKLFGIKPIRIGAQLYLKKFYNEFGFVEIGDVYIEDGIVHIEMVRNSNN